MSTIEYILISLYSNLLPLITSILSPISFQLPLVRLANHSPFVFAWALVLSCNYLLPLAQVQHITFNILH